MCNFENKFGFDLAVDNKLYLKNFMSITILCVNWINGIFICLQNELYVYK